jgi:predicted extracellular nuclease
MRTVLLFAILIWMSISCSVNAQKQKRTIGFYNVENLFDTIKGPNDDSEFLPDSKNQWNSQKYFEKLDHINQVFDQWDNPLIIGMCEIENARVVRDVIKRSSKLNGYGVVHYESPDARGIDVALIYDSSVLELCSSGNLRFTIPSQDSPSSRDIVWGKFAYNKDTIVAMVNHWPSRRGGQNESEPGRLEAAKTARKFIDSLLTVNKNYKIVFMGDLNDHPGDKAPQLIDEKLDPFITKRSGEFGGTHSYNNEWDVLDHIFVSPGFIKKKKIKVIKESGKIHSYDFLLSEYKGNIVPFRTYAGSRYLGGYSDHFPVSIEVSIP